MAIPQQKIREIIFQLLFSQSFVFEDEDELIHMMMSQLAVTKKVMKDAFQRCKEVFSHKSFLDETIAGFSKAYDFSRIGEVEKNILRLAVYELFYVDSVPSKVVIAEAIRITRKFATAESANFVNAVLDAIYQENKEAIVAKKEENYGSSLDTPVLSVS